MTTSKHDNEKSAKIASANDAICLRDVSIQRGDTLILDDVNWSLKKGESAAILGQNGSGKTTLMRAITGYEWASKGTVSVLGGTLGKGVDVRALRRRVVTVDPSERFGVDNNLPIWKAVATGFFGSIGLYESLTRNQEEHARHLVKVVGLKHRVEHPLGVLSTGEKRRALLARALVQLPEILILDEPTAGLDVNAREHLLATLERMRNADNAPTTLLVTHHVEEISPTVDKVLMLKNGRVIADGPPRQLITPESMSDLMDCKVFVREANGRFWLEVLPEAWVELLAGKKPFLGRDKRH